MGVLCGWLAIVSLMLRASFPEMLVTTGGSDTRGGSHDCLIRFTPDRHFRTPALEWHCALMVRAHKGDLRRAHNTACIA